MFEGVQRYSPMSDLMTDVISSVPSSRTANLGNDVTLCPSLVQLVEVVGGLAIDSHGRRASDVSDAFTDSGKSTIDGRTKVIKREQGPL